MRIAEKANDAIVVAMIAADYDPQSTVSVHRVQCGIFPSDTHVILAYFTRDDIDQDVEERLHDSGVQRFVA